MFFHTRTFHPFYQFPCEMIRKAKGFGVGALKRVFAHKGYDQVKDRLFLKKSDWNLSDLQIERSLDTILLDGAIDRTLNSDLCLFLYAKEIKKYSAPDSRVVDFKNLLNAESLTGIPQEVKRKLIMGKERLIRIVELDEDSYDFSDNSENFFSKFVQKHPEWNSTNSFVVFRDHPALSGKNSYVERFQKNGLCYLHAPVVLQHYLVSMNSQEHIPMLNISAFLKRNLDPNALEKHIWNDEGGDSLAFLLSILETGYDTEFTPVTTCSFADLIHRYGPALIQGFVVDTNFYSDCWRHLGKSKADRIGMHAMILVGYRYEKQEVRYLIQNWWEMKPFVEVDASYLHSRHSFIHFVQTPQYEIRNFQTNFHDHVECEMLDSPEKFAPNGNSNFIY